MHICFISPCQFNEFTGGIDRVCCQLIREFAKLELVMTSCFLNHSKRKGVDNVTHCQFPNSEEAMSYANVDYLHNLILSKQIDIVWLHTYMQGQWECVKKAVRGTPAKLVYTFHSDPVAPLIDLVDSRDYYRTSYLINLGWKNLATYLRSVVKYPIGYYLRRRYLQHYYRSIAENCNLVTFLSCGAEKDFVSLAGRGRVRLEVVRNPIDIVVDMACTKKKQILFVGRLVWQKRVDRLLKAWRKLQNNFPDWKLLIVGDGPDKTLFHQMVDRLKLKRVSFEGSQPSLEYYKDAVLVCVPSSHEGFCLVAFEGLANGCIPVFFDSDHSLVELLGYGYSVRAWSQDGLVRVLSTSMCAFDVTGDIRGGGTEVLHSLTPKKIALEYIKQFEMLLK